MVLVFLFMAGYYFLDSPSVRLERNEAEYAIARSDLSSVAECTAARHTAAIKNMIFQDVCAEQYGIKTEFVCLNERHSIVKCEIVDKRKPEYSFIITSSAPVPNEDYNRMMEVIDDYYPDAGSFGIFMDDVILSPGNAAKRNVPTVVSTAANLEPGQLVYMTQYEIPDVETDFIAPAAADINCGAGTIRAYRFGRWQCVEANVKTNCPGDKIWDSNLMECVADNSRKPLCAEKQTAVLVDDIWECVDPFADIECDAGMIARLNYSSLEWECITDPYAVKTMEKCSASGRNIIRGGRGAALFVSSNNCTDCEDAVTDPDTCKVTCVPSAAKLNDPKCYPNTSSCGGSDRAFYFGFPNAGYAATVSALAGYAIPTGALYSQNRKFNCLDCGERGVNADKSVHPFIAVCN